MTRANKKERKLERANFRRKLRSEKSKQKRENNYRYWKDNTSPTGYSQKCCYEAYGTCPFPCNGDC